MVKMFKYIKVLSLFNFPYIYQTLTVSMFSMTDGRYHVKWTEGKVRIILKKKKNSFLYFRKNNVSGSDIKKKECLTSVQK